THTAPDALFAINTYFWLPGGPHGTDAGYWIPYFTGRQTTASMMLFTSSGTRAYRAEIVAKSQAAERLENDPTAVVELQTLGVDYIYIGQRGDFASIGLKAETLREFDGLEEVYARDGVSIFHLTNPAPTSVIDEQVP